VKLTTLQLLYFVKLLPLSLPLLNFTLPLPVASITGQYQAMTTAIATIIRDYNSGQVIQELLQNCDDARARNVTFVLDKRNQCCKVGNAMDPFLGPALLQYDDAVFLPKDFASLQKTGDSEKKVGFLKLVADIVVAFLSALVIT
jgi:hypothetical protein